MPSEFQYPYKAIAIDLDGTLLNTEKKVFLCLYLIFFFYNFLAYH